MGAACSAIAPLPRRILLIGQSSAGKTQLLYTLKSYDSDPTTTDGFNVERLASSSGRAYVVWDLSGAASFQLRHRQFYYGSDGLIYMVDSTRQDEKETIKSNFNKLLMEKDLSSLPLLVLINKCDLSGTVSEEEWKEILDLKNLKVRMWTLVTICAKSKADCQKAIDVLDTLFET